MTYTKDIALVMGVIVENMMTVLVILTVHVITTPVGTLHVPATMTLVDIQLVYVKVTLVGILRVYVNQLVLIVIILLVYV